MLKCLNSCRIEQNADAMTGATPMHVQLSLQHRPGIHRLLPEIDPLWRERCLRLPWSPGFSRICDPASGIHHHRSPPADDFPPIRRSLPDARVVHPWRSAIVGMDIACSVSPSSIKGCRFGMPFPPQFQTPPLTILFPPKVTSVRARRTRHV